MPSIRNIIIIIPLLAFLLLAVPSFAQGKDGQDSGSPLFNKEAPVEITADTLTYDKEKNTYFAQGDVVIVQEGTTLMSDEAMVDMDSKVATAKGSVRVVDEGGNTLSGDTLDFDIDDKTAVVFNGRLFFKEQNVHITGDPLKKTGPQSYAADRATFTTCDCEEGEYPAWFFYTSDADVTVGDFLKGRNAFFYIKGVPVFYMPYFAIPIKRERQTGFLAPKPGYSRLKGFFLEESFFWAISDNTDATFSIDYQASRGVGEGAEYRYIRNRKSSGEIYFFHFQENDMDRVRTFRQDASNLSRPQTADENRWWIKLNHTEYLPWGFVFRANINRVSDDEFFLDFGKGLERSLESLESNVSLSKSWNGYSLVTQFRVFDNLLSAQDTDTLQRVPEITLNKTDTKIVSSPFYFSFESSMVNFYRETGVTGTRLDYKPKVSLPMNTGYVEITPSLSPRATFYNVEDASKTYYDRFLYEAKVEATTTLVRYFTTDGGPVYRHTVRPKLTYTYVPEAVQGDLPQFDSVDNIAATNSVTYSLNTIITGRYIENGIKNYMERMYLDLSQSYNINEATRALTSSTDERKPFSEISGELRLKPYIWTAFTAKGVYHVYNNNFNSYDISISASDKRGDSISLANRFVRAGVATTTSTGASTTASETSNYFEAALRGHVSEKVDLTYFKRYSFEDSSSLETSYAVEYNHQCWGAILTYTQRPEEKAVYLVFTLRGLGKIAGLQGSLP